MTSIFIVALFTFMKVPLLICSSRSTCMILRVLGCMPLIPRRRITNSSFASCSGGRGVSGDSPGPVGARHPRLHHRGFLCRRPCIT